MSDYGICPYSCSNKTEYGYCKTTACTNPEYSNKFNIQGIYNTFQKNPINRSRCACGYNFINNDFRYCPYCGRKRSN